MSTTADDAYRLPVCILIAAVPLALALLITYFAEPRGVILFDWRPLGWLADYAVIWPVVWISTEILRSAKWMWYTPAGSFDICTILRLTGGFLLIYLVIWLMAVPLIYSAAVKYPWLRIVPPSYSQLLRFLTGVAGSVVLRLGWELWCLKQAAE